VERETEETTDEEQKNFQGCTAQIPPPVIPISVLEPDVLTTLPKTTPIPESDIPKSLPKQNILYPSRRDNQKSRDKASNQMEKIFQIFQDLRFDISFVDALLLKPRFTPTIKSLLMNKEKLLELAKIPLNENCSAMLLKKLPKSLEMYATPWPESFLFYLSLHELTPTRMTLELADRSITYPKGLAEDVFLKVGFLGHAGFYRRFIQDFSKIARPMTHLLEKDTPFVFSKDCIDALQILKRKITEAPILVVPD
ncbi:hypothetical protein Tco_0119742, partial [Tanacetum coccineum]